MLSYRPGDTLAHRLDPRSKLAVQVGFAAAAFAHTTPRGLLALGAVALGCLAAAGVSPLRAAHSYRAAFPLLLLAPVVAAATLGPPWVDVGRGAETALASVRVLLVLLVSAAYVATTPVRDSRAAVQRTVPGRVGQFLGVGVALVFRFLPLLRRDVLTVREAAAARLGTERPLRDRMALLTAAGLSRALGRADRLSLALRARCFAWNPTLPALRFSRADIPALALAAALLAAGIAGTGTV